MSVVGEMFVHNPKCSGAGRGPSTARHSRCARLPLRSGWHFLRWQFRKGWL